MFHKLEDADTILIHMPYSPGDSIVLTETIHAVKEARPDLRIAVEVTGGRDIFKGNPDVSPRGGRMHRITLGLPFGLSEQYKFPRFCELLWMEFFNKLYSSSGWRRITTNRPFLYLDDDEKKFLPTERQYITVVCGGKRDTPVKIVPRHVMQPVVNWLKDKGFEVVQVGSKQDIHHHLDGVIDMIGKTTLRELFSTVYNSEAVVCGITMVHHVAAAFSVPSVTVCGGRERTELTEYDTSIMLKADDLPCCKDTGCWKYDYSSGERGCVDKVEISTPGVIQLPVVRDYYPKCMDEIGPDMIINCLKIILVD